jgi:fructose-1,6-bisphosphatase/inositol monophosphatase family enzyme
LPQVGRAAKRNRSAAGFKLTHYPGVAEFGLALLVTGFSHLRVQQHDNLPEFAPFMQASQGVRLGSAALDLCFVACGWLDGSWERHIKSWGARSAILEVDLLFRRRAVSWRATAGFTRPCWMS